jgi:hypothetical protein
LIIESIFQGTIPIRRVYFNGKVAWQPPKYLPPYLIYLDAKSLGDQTLSKIHLEQAFADIIEDPISSAVHTISTITVEAGNMFVDEVGEMYTKGSPIGADLFLVNRDVTEEYAPKAIQNIMAALHIAQIEGEYNAGPDLFVEKYGTALGTMIGSRIVTEDTYYLGDEAGISASGVILPHDVLVNILTESVINGVSSTGKIVEYGVLENFIYEHDATGLGADGKLGDFTVLENFLYEHNATGLGANGKLGDFRVLENFLYDHNATGLGANGKLGDFGVLENFLYDHNATGLGANGKLGDFGVLENFLYEHNVIALPAKAELGIVSATLTINATAERQLKSLDSKRPSANRVEDVTSTTDSHLTNFSVPLIDHDAVHIVEHTDNVRPSSISAESLSFVKQDGAYDSESFATKIDLSSFKLDSTVKTESESTANISIMFWLFPVQTGSDLYIPQVYDNGVVTGAVQNGSELIM